MDMSISPQHAAFRDQVRAFIAVRELGTFLGEDALRNGVRVMISSWRKFHHTMLPTMAKASGHYANSVLAAHEAMDHGFDDAILLNQDGTVASATGQNVFFVKSGMLNAPVESSGTPRRTLPSAAPSSSASSRLDIANRKSQNACHIRSAM